jgi:hypothetical protein
MELLGDAGRNSPPARRIEAEGVGVFGAGAQGAVKLRRRQTRYRPLGLRTEAR